MNESPGNSKRANIRLDHMEQTLVEIKQLAEKRNMMQLQDTKEHNTAYLHLCENVASLKTEVRILGGLVISATAIMIGIYLAA